MLEVHITGWAATAHDKSALTVAQVEASQTEEEAADSSSSHDVKTTLPMVELYTQLGSQVTICSTKFSTLLLPCCNEFSVFLIYNTCGFGHFNCAFLMLFLDSDIYQP